MGDEPWVISVVILLYYIWTYLQGLFNLIIHWLFFFNESVVIIISQCCIFVYVSVIWNFGTFIINRQI
jgi:hypothetical protein